MVLPSITLKGTTVYSGDLLKFSMYNTRVNSVHLSPGIIYRPAVLLIAGAMFAQWNYVIIPSRGGRYQFMELCFRNLETKATKLYTNDWFYHKQVSPSEKRRLKFVQDHIKCVNANAWASKPWKEGLKCPECLQAVSPT